VPALRPSPDFAARFAERLAAERGWRERIRGLLRWPRLALVGGAVSAALVLLLLLPPRPVPAPDPWPSWSWRAIWS